MVSQIDDGAQLVEKVKMRGCCAHLCINFGSICDISSGSVVYVLKCELNVINQFKEPFFWPVSRVRLYF